MNEGSLLLLEPEGRYLQRKFRRISVRHADGRMEGPVNFSGRLIVEPADSDTLLLIHDRPKNVAVWEQFFMLVLAVLAGALIYRAWLFLH